MKQGKEKNATYCNSRYGPIFGGGRDLCIYNSPQVGRAHDQSHSNFGHTYQLPTGYVYDSEQARNLLAGQYKFLTTEMEIFN